MLRYVIWRRFTHQRASRLTIFLADLRLDFRQAQDNHVTDDLQTARTHFFKRIFGRMPVTVVAVSVTVLEIDDVHRLPRRVVQATGKLTRQQAALVERIKTLFGGTLQHEFIGRKVFITANNDSRNWYTGQMLSGAIGPAGKMELTLYRLGGDVKITNRIGLEVYLKD